MRTGVKKGDSSYNGGSSEDIAPSDDVDIHPSRPRGVETLSDSAHLLPLHPLWLPLPAFFLRKSICIHRGSGLVRYHSRAYST